MSSSIITSNNDPISPARNHRPPAFEHIPASKDGRAVLTEYLSKKNEAFVEVRQKPEARYMAQFLPTVVGRGAWGAGRSAAEVPWYKETVTSISQLPAKGVATIMAGRVMVSMNKYGWPSDIAGMKGGGEVTGLPQVTMTTSTDEAQAVSAITWRLDDELEIALSQTWGIPLVAIKNTARGYFPFARTMPTVVRPGERAPDGEAALSSVLPHLLATSLFGHHMQIMLREMVGPTSTAEGVQTDLQEWANHYVTEDPKAGNAEKAERPFSAVKVTVRNKAGRPGHYEADVKLVPHYRLEQITATMMLKSYIDDPTPNR